MLGGIFEKNDIKGKIQTFNKKVTENNLERELNLLLENKQEAAIILHTDKTVDIEFVVKVMDIAYRNKYRIVLATTSN